MAHHSDDPGPQCILVAHQPAYLPWQGYFARLLDVNRLVLLDHVQFAERGRQHHNWIRGSSGGRHLLDLLGIHWIEDNQWEADDVIASLIAAQPAREHLIMSTDKDFYQLLSHQVSVLNTQRRADRRRIYPAEVGEKHGVLPHQWCDYRALTGDKSDNIPGIRGIGDKTAARFLADQAHLEDLDKLDRLTGRAGALIRHQWDDLMLWRTLIQLRTNIPLPTTTATQQPSRLPPAPDIIGQLDLWK